MGASEKYWWLQHVVTFVGFIIAAFMVIWQIAKQHRNSLLLQKNNMKDQLRLEVYKEFSNEIENAIKSVSRSMAQIVSLPISFRSQQEFYSILQIEPHPMKERSESIIELYNTANESTISLITLMERYEIAIPQFRKFINAFIELNHKFREAFNAFHPEIVKYLPIDVPEDKKEELGREAIPSRQPNEIQLTDLENLSNQYQDACIEFQAYFIDLRVALQNHLLGSLFDHKLPARKPNDPKRVVLKLED